jgi:Flp pilus assembly protein CpaB
MKPVKLLIVAGVLGVVAVVLLQVESWRSRGGTAYVFRATHAVQPPGTLKGAYEVVGIPMNVYEGMQSQVPTRDLEGWVSTAPVVRPIRAGETITFDALQKSADSGLQIAAGMRAVAIEVQAAQAVGYLVRPGDFVDVLGTADTQKDLRKTKQILQAKRVLAIDQQYRLEDSAFLQARTYSTVTIEVTPEEAEVVEWYRAVVRNGFSLALRPRGDRDIVETRSYPFADIVK